MGMSKVCPKCGYERRESDDFPEWGCPKCGVVYAKIEAINKRDKETPPHESRENADGGAVLPSILANLKTIFSGAKQNVEHALANSLPSSAGEVSDLHPPCPYCAERLETRPQRKKKCPHCGNYIFLKRRPDGKNKELVTETQALEIEKQWKEVHEHNELLNDLKEWGISEREFVRAKSKFDGGGAPDGDVIWSLLQKKLLSLAKNAEYSQMQAIYYKQAIYFARQGKDPNVMLYEANKMQLQDYKRLGAKKVQIIFSGNGCESCEKLDGKTMTISKALKDMPLPHKDCTADVFGNEVPFCRCSYATAD
jgi:predicted  nucleic acid-binding Zn-ribbon protein